MDVGRVRTANDGSFTRRAYQAEVSARGIKPAENVKFDTSKRRILKNNKNINTIHINRGEY